MVGQEGEGQEEGGAKDKSSLHTQNDKPSLKLDTIEDKGQVVLTINKVQNTRVETQDGGMECTYGEIVYTSMRDQSMLTT